MAVIPQDQLVLNNDAKGYDFVDRFHFFGFASESSAHGAAALAMVECFTVPPGYSGTIQDVGLGVVLPAVSASGFVSGTVTCTVRINSNAVCSTDPKIAMAGSAGQAYRVFTGGAVSGVASGLVTSAVVNAASNTINPGDQVAVDLTANSAGSAAAGAAGKGLYGYIRYRFKSR